MKPSVFDSQKSIGKGILSFDRQQLCEFAIKLCERVKADVGAGAYHGGIYPDNISIDENGALAIGMANKEDWAGQELQFLPPELYWNHKPTASADVYAIGMLLYYVVSGGKLPFDGECKDAQLRRMGGDDFAIPSTAGRRLGEIIQKATRFKASERYQSMDELRAMLESCLKNLYLNGAPSAETIFNKNDDDLSELERMMVGIIERDEDEPLPEYVEPPEPEEDAEPPVEAEADAPVDDFALAAEIAREAESNLTELHRIVPPVNAKAPTGQANVEKRADNTAAATERQPEITPAVQYPRNIEKERRMEEELKKRRRRPVAVILVLCAILVIVAIIFNAVIKNINRSMEALNNTNSVSATVDAQAGTDAQSADVDIPVETVLPTAHVVPEDELLPIAPDASATPYIPGGADSTDAESTAQTDTAQTDTAQEHRYELIIADISWTDAQKKCAELGGHLAVPNDAAEFNTLVELAESKGITRIWIGGHRKNGEMVWDDGSTDPFVQWAKGEPSYVDTSDGAAEDYVLLWYNNGWYYNDSRNDPCAEYPQWYSGQVAYICEYGG